MQGMYKHYVVSAHSDIPVVPEYGLVPNDVKICQYIQEGDIFNSENYVQTFVCLNTIYPKDGEIIGPGGSYIKNCQFTSDLMYRSSAVWKSGLVECYKISEDKTENKVIIDIDSLVRRDIHGIATQQPITLENIINELVKERKRSHEYYYIYLSLLVCRSYNPIYGAVAARVDPAADFKSPAYREVARQWWTNTIFSDISGMLKECFMFLKWKEYYGIDPDRLRLEFENLQKKNEEITMELNAHEEAMKMYKMELEECGKAIADRNTDIQSCIDNYKSLYAEANGLATRNKELFDELIKCRTQLLQPGIMGGGKNNDYYKLQKYKRKYFALKNKKN